MTRAASKRKKTARTVVTPQQRLQQQIVARYVGLFPRGLKLILVGDAITIVKGFLQAYKQQLGEKHDLTMACLSHLETLQTLSRGFPSDYNDKPTTLSIQNLIGSLAKLTKS
jgi:hypothetical protein